MGIKTSFLTKAIKRRNNRLDNKLFIAPRSRASSSVLENSTSVLHSNDVKTFKDEQLETGGGGGRSGEVVEIEGML